MKNLGKWGLLAALFFVLAAREYGSQVKAAGGPEESANGPYRVLAPIESGNLLLFPVVRTDGKSAVETPFITLDEGLKSGEVEVTEAGRAHGLVRPKGRSSAAIRSRRRSEHASPGQPLQAAVAVAGG